MALLYSACGLLAACGGGTSSADTSIPSAPAAPGAGAPAQSNLVYVALGANQSSEANPRIEAFPLNTSGNITPSKTIAQDQNDMPAPSSIAFDGGGNLYVANNSYPGLQGSTDYVSVFPPGANGTAPPIRTVGAAQGSTLGSNTVEGLGVDADGYLYVAESSGEIFVFAPGANGNVPPVRTLTSSACGQIGGLAVTPSGEAIVSCVTSGIAAIETFAAGASTNAMPASVISGNGTLLANGGSVAISPLGFIVVLQRNVQTGSILTFPLTANGNVAPATDITGPSTLLTGNGGVTVDASGNIYAIDTQGSIGPINSSTITEYAPKSTGNAAPINTISGSNTNLTIGWWGIAIGPP